MKNLKLRNWSKWSLLPLMIFVAFSCEDPDKAPIVTFDSAGHGAYPRFVSEAGATLMNLLTEAEFNASDYTWTVEFVDEAQGGQVAEYVVEITYDPASGSDQGPVEFVRIPGSAFTSGESGYLQTTISSAAPDIAGLFGLGYADLSAGDDFDFNGRIIMTDGREFTGATSSATVNGAAFIGRFDFTRPAACPSDLTGTYSYVTTNIWCDGSATVTGDVDVEALGGGRYQFSDWAFGSYGTCYGGGTAGGDLTFTEVCEVVSFTGFTDSFGDTWTYTSSISGEEWTIAWDNTYGESATSVITFPGGVPFTLAP